MLIRISGMMSKYLQYMCTEYLAHPEKIVWYSAIYSIPSVYGSTLGSHKIIYDSWFLQKKYFDLLNGIIYKVVVDIYNAIYIK